MIPDVILLSMTQPAFSTTLAVGGILTGVADLFGGITLFIIGIAVIVLIVAAAVVLLPATVVAALIWLLTGSFFYAASPSWQSIC